MKLSEIFKFDDNDKKVFFLSIFFGVIVHFIAIANNLYHSDGIGFNIVESEYEQFLGASFISGRWGLGLINMLLNNIGYTIKVPSACVLLAIFFISFSNIFLFRLLNIKNNILKIILMSATVASPSLVNIFYYAFTGHIYVLSILFAVFSVYLLIKTDYVILPVIFMVFSMSIYQANVGVIMCLSIICVYIILQNGDINNAVKKAIEASVSFVIAFAIYLALMYIFNTAFKLNYFFDFYSTTEQKLLPNLNIAEIFGDIINCYKSVFKLFYGESLFAFNETIYAKMLNLIFFIVSMLSFIALTIKSKIKASAKILSIILLLVFPIAINIVFVMTRSKIPLSESRTVYSYIFYLILGCLITDQLLDIAHIKHIKKVFPIFALITALIVNDKIILAHHSYYNMQKQLEDLKGFTTELATRIMSLDGYSEDKYVVCIGLPVYKTNLIYDNYVKFTFPMYEDISNLVAAQYINWVKVINHFAGTHFKYMDDNLAMSHYYTYHRSVKNMPMYPNDGSIKIVGDVIIVTFFRSPE